MTNYPWPMDKPIEEILDIIEFNLSNEIRHHKLLPSYLLDRLKIAEAERDEYKDRWLYDEKNETF